MKKWHAEERGGPYPLGRLTSPQSDICQVGLDESWEKEKKSMKKRSQKNESPFFFLLTSFCTSFSLRSSSLALILSTPFLMPAVRGVHLFCSGVFCCCHSRDVSSSAYAQVSKGRVGGDRQWGLHFLFPIMTHLWESDTKGQRERSGRNSKSRYQSQGIWMVVVLQGQSTCQLGMTANECGEKPSRERGCIDILNLIQR